jgi:hypothetical protein
MSDRMHSLASSITTAREHFRNLQKTTLTITAISGHFIVPGDGRQAVEYEIYKVVLR